MKFSFVALLIAGLAISAPVPERPVHGGIAQFHKGHKAATAGGNVGGTNGTNNTTTTATTTTSSAVDPNAGVGAVDRPGDVVPNAATLVFDEVGGIPGNTCLTFRNNGDIVDAACVNEAADRQFTPSTLNGQNVLLVQRGFSDGFRPDLVGVQACVGNNGTTFKALPCDNLADPVSFDGTSLVAASGACQSGHDDAAQLTIDATGKNCATVNGITVLATPAPADQF
ncbi:hypothetical protein CYLTODRAFT_439439 [Cylindrobasidium torrendii FP15055 ss-10]|uniref:Ricin B lectin domain-containing protein n=1 Tax=Cylindrobasidium torrendii FP15055 ss-10 TaxID=1314674 RepID=A0A0D7BUC8_9AGAR|nr:hypothetical protein CYLTODRAFT_439439 [Cylindrobasidium torrendii FP15055 ss-10]